MKRLTYKYIKKQIESIEGYKLLSKEYKNAKMKLKVQCNKKHTYLATWDNFKKGVRCPYCAGNAKLTYEHIKNHIKKSGYHLISKIYKNSETKLDIQCNNGHIYQTNWNNFQSGNRCSYCAGNIRNSYEYIKSQIESVDGYKLLSKKYKNALLKLKVQCNKKHNYEVTWSNFQRNHRCPYCAGNAKPTYKYIKNFIESVEDYQLISKTYKNNSTKLEIKCNKGHIYQANWDVFQRGQRCPKCKFSVGEKEVLSLVKSLTNGVIENDRTQIINPKTNRNLELDIWIPLSKKAIEYNGYYWHSLPGQQYKDGIKVQQCKKKNINLMIVEEMEWINNKEKCISNITNFINP